MTAPAPATEPLVRHLQQTLQAELRAHPYRTIAIAAGLGYLLGTRLGRPLLALLAGRVATQIASNAIAPLIDELLVRR